MYAPSMKVATLDSAPAEMISVPTPRRYGCPRTELVLNTNPGTRYCSSIACSMPEAASSGPDRCVIDFGTVCASAGRQSGVTMMVGSAAAAAASSADAAAGTRTRQAISGVRRTAGCGDFIKGQGSRGGMFVVMRPKIAVEPVQGQAIGSAQSQDFSA